MDRGKFIKIPGTEYSIRQEFLRMQSQFALTHKVLNENRNPHLSMPSIPIFMKHYVNIIQAATGNGELIYEDNTPVERSVVSRLFEQVIDVHSQSIYCFLDARFWEDRNTEQMMIATNHSVSGGKLVSGHEEPLEHCVHSGFVDLEFNRQGMPIRESSLDKYTSGKNMTFEYPGHNHCVALFIADGVIGFRHMSGLHTLSVDHVSQYTGTFPIRKSGL